MSKANSFISLISLKEKREHILAIFGSHCDTPYSGLHSLRLEIADNSILSTHLTSVSECQSEWSVTAAAHSSK